MGNKEKAKDKCPRGLSLDTGKTFITGYLLQTQNASSF
jgi:hypothetical protein